MQTNATWEVNSLAPTTEKFGPGRLGRSKMLGRRNSRCVGFLCLLEVWVKMNGLGDHRFKSRFSIHHPIFGVKFDPCPGVQVGVLRCLSFW